MKNNKSFLQITVGLNWKTFIGSSEITRLIGMIHINNIVVR